MSIGLGAVALTWGLFAGSSVLVFDGVYMLVGIVLSALSLIASRAAVRAPSQQYPFGLRAVTPLAIGVQGAALLGTLVYASVDAILAVLAGGDTVAPRTVLLYGIVTFVASAAVTVWLSRWGRRIGSELVVTEAASWKAGTVLSLVFALGGAAALLLEDRFPPVVEYTDPVLVLVACVGLAPIPFQLLRSAGRELLEAAPPPEVLRAIDDAVRDTSREFGLERVHVRSTKLGGRLYVETDFIVEPGRWRVDEEDEVRRRLIDRLTLLPYDLWATVELTTDPALAE